MRLITHIETCTNLNAKAKALAPFVNLYTGCLFTPQQYNDFVLSIEKLLEDLNAQYPRTKPFIIYSRNKHYIYICVDGSPDKNEKPKATASNDTPQALPENIDYFKSIYSFAKRLGFQGVSGEGGGKFDRRSETLQLRKDDYEYTVKIDRRKITF